MSVQEGESSNKLWLVIFVLLSLLAHVVAILAIILISMHMPVPKVELPQASPEVTLSLLPPPPAIQPPKRSIFLNTQPDPTAKPNQNTPIESDNTTELKSKTQTSRAPDSVLPDVVAKKNRSLDFQNTPYVPPTPNPQMASNPSAQKPNPQKPSPPQPQAQAQQPPPKPSPPTPKPPSPNPAKTTTTQIVKNDVDPNGLPVLPPIVAATMAPQTPVNPMQQVQNQTAARPPPSLQTDASNIQGRAGMQGSSSPSSNATELGRYKAKFYRAVGSRWYAKVNQSFQILPVGTVRIQYTIHSDGIVDNIKILDGNNSILQLLLSISQNSITESSPFDPFTDSMRKEVAKDQGNDGESYTDDFTFSIYGG